MTILHGDCRSVLASLDAGSVNCCVTSPPYFGLRNYHVDGQIGLEPTPDAFVAEMVGVFREVRRVLRDDATLWLNLGDSYAGSGRGGNPDAGTKQGTNRGSQTVSVLYNLDPAEREAERARIKALNSGIISSGLKPKDLIGIPWRVAFALQADGWYLRSAIVWNKPNPMPESVTDRPTSAYEMVFLLTKSERYFYDADAIREALAESSVERLSQPNIENQAGSSRANVGAKTNGPMKAVARKTDKQSGHSRRHAGFNDRWDAMEEEGQCRDGRNARNVWTIATRPFKEAHFATFPTDLAERCIKAGCPAGGTVLDPFGGAGTTGLVADRLQRNAILIDLNPDYIEIARKRIDGDAPLFGGAA